MTVWPLTSCEAERSFSGLRRLKTYLRSSTKKDRLNGLALLMVYRSISISMKEIIDVLQVHSSGEWSFHPSWMMQQKLMSIKTCHLSCGRWIQPHYYNLYPTIRFLMPKHQNCKASGALPQTLMGGAYNAPPYPQAAVGGDPSHPLPPILDLPLVWNCKRRWFKWSTRPSWTACYLFLQLQDAVALVRW